MVVSGFFWLDNSIIYSKSKFYSSSHKISKTSFYLLANNGLDSFEKIESNAFSFLLISLFKSTKKSDDSPIILPGYSLSIFIVRF